MSTATAPALATVDQLSKLAVNAVDKRLNIDDIFMNTEENVRESYETEGMQELKDNIEAVGGILQPLLVVETEPSADSDNKAYILVAGFRRFISLQALVREGQAQYGKNLPVRVMPLDTQGGLKITQLIENLVRRDLNPLEKAQGIREAMSDASAGLKAVDVSKLLGMSEGSISQLLKLLDLPDSVQEMVASGEISFSHARIIMFNVPQARWVEAADVAKGMTYGEFEAYAKKRYGSDETGAAPVVTAETRTAQVRRATKVTGTYLPYFQKQAAEATTDADKLLWTTRVDTVKWMLSEADTELAKAVEPFEKDLEAKEQAEKDAKDAESKKTAFTKARIVQLRDLQKALPAEGQRRNTFAENLAIITKTVEAAAAPEKKAETGFEIGDVTAYMTEFQTAWTEAEAARVKADAARAAAAAKRKADKKAEEEAAKKTAAAK